MIQANSFTVQADGSIMRDQPEWVREAAWSPLLLAEAAAQDVIRTTIKVKVANGWALYRVTGLTSDGCLITKRLRRGRV